MANEISLSPPKQLEQEDAASQEFNDFISTLPKHKGWRAPPLYQFEGFRYSIEFIQGLISYRKHFQPQDFDIFLATIPKSGTTWLKALIFTLMNRHRHPIDKDHPLLNTNPHQLVPFLEIKFSVKDKIPDPASYSSLGLFSTHMPYDSLPESIRNRCKIVYLCRNPKDSFVSLWHFMNRLKLQDMRVKSITEAFDLFCNGITICGPFWDHVLQYWKESKKNPDTILFLKFEDVKRQPGMHVRKLAEFLNCRFSTEEEESGLVEKILELCSLENLSSLEVNRNGRLSSGERNDAFFRRGQIGDWKNYLSDEMVERIDQITEEKFEGSGLVL